MILVLYFLQGQTFNLKCNNSLRNQTSFFSISKVNFLKEFCAFSQTLQPQNRDAFFKTLSNMGILPALEVILVSG